MGIFLLFVIYVAFIGLGLPDSLFGVAWPAIYEDCGFPFSFGSFVTAIVYCGTVVASVFSARLIRTFGTYRITVLSTVLTAAALLAFSYSDSLVGFCLCAVPLGLGAGCIDTALNNYVALHYSSRQMNFLHCFYGIGITLSPYVLSFVLGQEGGWRTGYRIAFAIQFMLALIVLLSLPLWRKAPRRRGGSDEGQIRVMGFKEVMEIQGVKPMCLILVGLSAVESVCNAWGATYLVERLSLTPERAAAIVMFYFIGMACGRFLAGVVASKLHNWTIVFAGQAILGVALVVLLLSRNEYLSAIAFFLVGFGNGPLFPNVNFLVPEMFGGAVSPSVMGALMAVGSVSMMSFPVLGGFLGQAFGVWVFPVMMMVFCVIMFAASIRVAYRKI